MPELRDDIARVVDRIDSLLVIPGHTRGPARVERVERAGHRGGLAGAIVVHAAEVAHVRPSVKRLRIRDLVLGPVAIGVRRVRDTEPQGGAEKVVVLEAEAARIGAAGARVLAAEVDGPGIARDHVDVDHAVVICRRPDVHVVEEAVGAQQALGLVDHALRDAIAGPEEEHALDHHGARADVQRIDEAEDPVVFAGIGEVEDVRGVHANASDPGAFPFKLAERRNGASGRDFGSVGGVQEPRARRQAGERPEEDSVHFPRHAELYRPRGGHAKGTAK